MQIPIDQFELYIDETILKRGLSYFKKGMVTGLERISQGKYEAIVTGNDDYRVSLTIEQGVITEYTCNCPYDMGSICKHVVAVIFELQQDILHLKKSADKSRSKQSHQKAPKAPQQALETPQQSPESLQRSNQETPAASSQYPPESSQQSTKPTTQAKPTTQINPTKRKGIAEKIQSVLDKASSEDIKKFVYEQALNDKYIRNALFALLVPPKLNQSKDFYEKQIKKILSSSKDRYGFVEWYKAREINKAVNIFLNTAHQHIADNQYQSALYICTAVLEQMTAALEYVDDSNGDIGSLISAARNITGKIIESPIDETTRKELLEYSIETFDKRVFSGWDWDMEMLENASLLLVTKKEADSVLQRLENHNFPKYIQDRIQSIYYYIVLKIEGENAADRYMEQHLSNPEMRKKYIEKSIKKKDYEKAKSIAKDGLKYDKDYDYGKPLKWLEFLFTIAQEQKDIPHIIEYARELFINDNLTELNSPRTNYYKLLKDYVDKKEWESFVKNMVKEIEKKQSWNSFGKIANIYIEEQWWKQLLKHVKQLKSFRDIKVYEKYLAPYFADEIVNMYDTAIRQYVKTNIGREYYRETVRYLRRIIKLGKKEKAEEIILFLRSNYSSRRSLLEELNFV